MDAFIPASDFFTLDVADFTGKAAEEDAIYAFLKAVRHYTGSLSIPGIARPFDLTEETVRGAARKFLLAVQEAGRIYRHVEERKGRGRFNKGVDYVGDLAQFEKEFDEDLCVIAFAIREFGLADTLKLSVHSGSDKFSIYSLMNRLIKKHDVGIAR